MLGTPLLVSAVPFTMPLSEPRPVRDTDVAALQEYLQCCGLERVSKDIIHQATDLRATECAFHPVRDYLNGLHWDSRSRLANWLSTYLGAVATPYTAGIGTMFLVAMVGGSLRPAASATTCSW